MDDSIEIGSEAYKLYERLPKFKYLKQALEESELDDPLKDKLMKNCIEVMHRLTQKTTSAVQIVIKLSLEKISREFNSFKAKLYKYRYKTGKNKKKSFTKISECTLLMYKQNICSGYEIALQPNPFFALLKKSGQSQPKKQRKKKEVVGSHGFDPAAASCRLEKRRNVRGVVNNYPWNLPMPYNEKIKLCQDLSEVSTAVDLHSTHKIIDIVKERYPTKARPYPYVNIKAKSRNKQDDELQDIENLYKRIYRVERFSHDNRLAEMALSRGGCLHLGGHNIKVHPNKILNKDNIYIWERRSERGKKCQEGEDSCLVSAEWLKRISDMCRADREQFHTKNAVEETKSPTDTSILRDNLPEDDKVLISAETSSPDSFQLHPPSSSSHSMREQTWWDDMEDVGAAPQYAAPSSIYHPERLSEFSPDEDMDNDLEMRQIPCEADMIIPDEPLYFSNQIQYYRYDNRVVRSKKRISLPRHHPALGPVLMHKQQNVKKQVAAKPVVDNEKIVYQLLDSLDIPTDDLPEFPDFPVLDNVLEHEQRVKAEAAANQVGFLSKESIDDLLNEVDLSKPVHIATEKVGDASFNDRVDDTKEAVENSGSIQRESKFVSKSLLSFLDQPSDDEEEIAESAGNAQVKKEDQKESMGNAKVKKEDLEESSRNIIVKQETPMEIPKNSEHNEDDFAGTFSDSDDEQMANQSENTSKKKTFVDLHFQKISGKADPRLARKKVQIKFEGSEVEMKRKGENISANYIEAISTQVQVASKEPTRIEVSVDSLDKNDLEGGAATDLVFTTVNKVIPSQVEMINEIEKVGVSDIGKDVDVTGKEKDGVTSKEDYNDDEEFVLTVDLDYEDEMKEIVDKSIDSTDKTLPIEDNAVKANPTKEATNLGNEEDSVDQFYDAVEDLRADKQSSVDGSFADKNISADKSIDADKEVDKEKDVDADKKCIEDKTSASTGNCNANLTTDNAEDFSDDGKFSDDDEFSEHGGGTDAEMDEFADLPQPVPQQLRYHHHFIEKKRRISKVKGKSTSDLYRLRQKVKKSLTSDLFLSSEDEDEYDIEYKANQEKVKTAPDKNNFSATKNNFSADKNNFSAAKRDFSADKSIYSVDKRDFSADKRNFSAEKGDFFADERNFPADKKEFSADKRDSSADKNNFSSDKSDFSADKSNFSNDKNDFSSDKSDFSADKRDFFAAKKDFSADKMDFSADKRDSSTDKNNFSADKSNFSADKSNFSAAKRNFSADKKDSSADKRDFLFDKGDFSANKDDFSADNREFSTDKRDFYADRSDFPVAKNDFFADKSDFSVEKKRSDNTSSASAKEQPPCKKTKSDTGFNVNKQHTPSAKSKSVRFKIDHENDEDVLSKKPRVDALHSLNDAIETIVHKAEEEAGDMEKAKTKNGKTKKAKAKGLRDMTNIKQNQAKSIKSTSGHSSDESKSKNLKVKSQSKKTYSHEIEKASESLSKDKSDISGSKDTTAKPPQQQDVKSARYQPKKAIISDKPKETLAKIELKDESSRSDSEAETAQNKEKSDLIKDKSTKSTKGKSIKLMMESERIKKSTERQPVKSVYLQNSHQSGISVENQQSAKPYCSQKEEKQKVSEKSAKLQNSHNSAKPQNSQQSAKPQNSQHSAEPQNSQQSAKPQNSQHLAEPKNSQQSARPQNSQQSAKHKDDRLISLPRKVFVRERWSTEEGSSSDDCRPRDGVCRPKKVVPSSKKVMYDHRVAGDKISVGHVQDAGYNALKTADKNQNLGDKVLDDRARVPAERVQEAGDHIAGHPASSPSTSASEDIKKHKQKSSKNKTKCQICCQNVKATEAVHHLARHRENLDYMDTDRYLENHVEYPDLDRKCDQCPRFVKHLSTHSKMHK